MTTEFHRQKILVVDDEADTRMFLCNLLGTCGYDAVGAVGGTEGLEKAKAEPPDLIILDIMMAREDGIAMYRNLKLDPDLKTVPVIVVSSIGRESFAVYRKSHNLWEDPARSPRAAYIEKPLEADELIKAVRRLTGPGPVSAG